MEEPPQRGGGRSKSLLCSIGRELVSIVAPVSACMLIVVILVRITSGSRALLGSDSSSIVTIAYEERPDDSDSSKFVGALLNSLVFVGFVTVATFVVVGLFKVGRVRFIFYYMALSTFTVLAFMGGQVALLLVQAFSIPIDVITFLIILLNFSVVGVMAALSLAPMPILFTQAYLVMVGVLVAFTFTALPEWTTWVLLVAMAIYDIAAVLLPGGPLNLLVKLAIQKNQQIPGLIYECRPPEAETEAAAAAVVAAAAAAAGETEVAAVVHTRKSRSVFGRGPETSYHSLASQDEIATQQEQQTQTQTSTSSEQEAVEIEQHEDDIIPDPDDESIPLVSRHIQPHMENLSSLIASERATTGDELEMTRASSSSSGSSIDASEQQQRTGVDSAEIQSVLGGGLKLGLGDFVFYSVLVGRAAMFDLMTVYACYLAIVAGLGVTLLLLAVWKRALPALPISIALGVAFYLLTRLLMEPFVLQLATSLVFF